MNKIDLVKLRKRAGMSQRELADLLQVRPSFLSAIENGRSRIPEEKLEKIKEIFEIENFDDYLLPNSPESSNTNQTDLHIIDQGDSFTHLLTHFHDLAHKNSCAKPDNELLSRIDFLTKKNDRLSERVDDLRDEVDRLRQENIRLKELLVKHGLEY